MIKITITQAAFDAIAATMKLGSVRYENATDEQGQRLIWLEPQVLDSLRALRWPSESYSDVIIRMAAYNAGGAFRHRGGAAWPRQAADTR